MTGNQPSPEAVREAGRIVERYMGLEDSDAVEVIARALDRFESNGWEVSRRHFDMNPVQIDPETGEYVKA